MNQPLHVLIVEDSEDDTLLLLRELRRGGYDPIYERVETAEAMQTALTEKSWEIVLADFNMPHFSAPAALALIQASGLDLPFIIVSGTVGEETAVAAMKTGANDYLMKGNLTRLIPAIRRELREAEGRRKRKQGEAELRERETKFRTLFNLLPVGISILDAERNVVEVNPALAQILNLDRKKLTQETYLTRRYLKPDGTPMPPAEFPSARALREKRLISDIEMGVVTEDGERIWTSVSAVPVEFPDWRVVVTTVDITWRKWAEESLWQSETFNRAVLNSLEAHLAVLDREGNIIAVNQAWETYARANGDPNLTSTGVGLNYLEVCRRAVGEGAEAAQAALAGIQAVSAGTLPQFTVEYICHSPAERRWSMLRATPMLDGRGGVVVAHEDITDRILAEQEILRRNRELTLLNQVIAASATGLEPESILELTCRELALTFELPYANAVLLDEENVMARVVADYVKADPAQPQTEMLNQTFPVAASPILQYLIDHKTSLVVADARHDARLVHFRELLRRRGVASLLFLPLIIEGEVIGGLSLAAVEPRHFSPEEIGLGWSVADQVSGALARTRLIQTQQRLSAVMEQVTESVVITDTKGDITYVNPAFERLSGYHRAEVIGQNPRILRSNQQEAAFYEQMWATITAGQVWHGRIVNKKKDGTLYTEEVTITPVRDESGGLINYVAVKRDVTRELLLEEQYRQAQKMEAIGRLSGGVAHDFNNLLVVINGYSELLLNRHLEPTSPLREPVEQIRDAGKRAAGLTRQLLAFSRQQVLQPQILDLNAVVTDVEQMLGRLIGEDVNLLTALDPELGQVTADAGQIEQILMNLAVNARDAMPRGGNLTIETANIDLDETYPRRLAGVAPGPYVMLAVSDTGIGMDEETQSHIFEPFFTTKELGRGTGLGLATVYGIVKQSGGEVWVYSELGRGTSFKIYLPRLGRKASTLGAEPDAAPKMPVGTETVLLVEDEEIVRSLAREVLEMTGYTVLEAGNGREALAVAEQHPEPIHLLLTDVVMPQINGREVAERLAAAHPQMKVLYVSGYTDQTIARHGVLEAGLFFLQKPFSPSTLAQKVREVLDAPGAV